MRSILISSFANKTRLKLLVCLGQGDKNVTELIGTCGLSQSAVSQHLEKLKEAKLIFGRRNGKEIVYKLADTRSAEIAKNLLKLEKEVDMNEG